VPGEKPHSGLFLHKAFYLALLQNICIQSCTVFMHMQTNKQKKQKQPSWMCIIQSDFDANAALFSANPPNKVNPAYFSRSGGQNAG
jgi:hypothetical protein